MAAADELADLAPHVAKVDLLKHSHALHQEDYLAAVDTLYKYFDCSTGKAASVLPMPCSRQPPHPSSPSPPRQPIRVSTCVPDAVLLYPHHPKLPPSPQTRMGNPTWQQSLHNFLLLLSAHSPLPTGLCPFVIICPQDDDTRPVMHSALLSEPFSYHLPVLQQI